MNVMKAGKDVYEAHMKTAPQPDSNNMTNVRHQEDDEKVYVNGMVFRRDRIRAGCT